MTMHHADSHWIDPILAHARFSDSRHATRMGSIIQRISAHPTASFPEAMGSRAETKATYRFLSNPRIDYRSILAAQYGATAERCIQQDVVLLIQDTSEVNLSGKGATAGLGHLDHPGCQGVKMHSVLAVSEQGVPQGILDMQCYTRSAGRSTSVKRPLPQKESYRWITAAQAAEKHLRRARKQMTSSEETSSEETSSEETSSEETSSEETSLHIHIADRESDFIDFLAAVRDLGGEVLIRAHYNRKVFDSELKIKQQIEQQPVLGHRTISIPAAPKRPARNARLSVRVLSTELAVPTAQKKRLLPQPMQVLHVYEESAPQGATPIEWWLLTTLRITTLQDAFNCVRYYTYRWLIERYHFTLKSGCGIEELQLKDSTRICSAIALYSYVAWRLLWLSYESRVSPDQSCEGALSPAEWQALWCIHHKQRTPPARAPSLGEAVVWIAQLGGFQARRGDGDPGVKTLWRGWRALSEITRAYLLFHPDVSNDTSYG